MEILVNLNENVDKKDLWVLWKISQNVAYVCEMCKLMLTFLAGKRFDNVFWKNKVDGTQKFGQTWKLALKLEKPTIENRKNLENSSRWKILFRYSNEVRNGAKII